MAVQAQHLSNALILIESLAKLSLTPASPNSIISLVEATRDQLLCNSKLTFSTNASPRILLTHAQMEAAYLRLTCAPLAFTIALT